MMVFPTLHHSHVFYKKNNQKALEVIIQIINKSGFILQTFFCENIDVKKYTVVIIFLGYELETSVTQVLIMCSSTGKGRSALG